MFSIALILLSLSVVYSLFFSMTEKKVIILNYKLIIAFMLLAAKSITLLFGISSPELFTSSLISLGNLEAFFMLIFSIVSVAILFYSNYYSSFLNRSKLNYYTIFTTLFLTSMLGVIVSAEAFTFLVFWEIMSLSSYFLVIHESDKNESRISGMWYLVLTHIGMFFIVAAFLPFIVKTGSSFFADWANTVLAFPSLVLVFVASLIGFGGKSGLFPLHIWLPKAHPIAPSHISALMSGFMVKLPVLMLLKFYLFFMSGLDIRFAYVLLVLGAITAFWGIFNGLLQNNIKKFLAYSTIENMGLIYVGLGIVVAGASMQNNIVLSLGVIATLFHTFNHSIYKTMMFSLAGSLIERTHHNYDYSKLGGIAKIFPIFSLFFLIATLAIAGIPPFNGFNSELTVYSAIINIITGNTDKILSLVSLFSLVLVGMMSVLAFIGFTKMYTIIFAGNARDSHIIVETKSNTSEYVSYSILTLSILALSFAPGIINLLASKIFSFVEAPKSLLVIQIGDMSYMPLLIVSLLLALGYFSYLAYKKMAGKEEKMDVWNCGYPYLVTKSQYKAESLIQAIRRLYRGLYSEKNTTTYTSKVEGKTYYKKYLTSIDYTRTYFLKVTYLFEKVISFVNYISAKLKSMQNGVLQNYVSYILFTLIAAIIYIIVF
ncbi:MAG: proton-conducting transporter membrane subunit [Candidatus Gracilibacteria bacterium]|nr:proton-conducting transporter membrane subunit [Candidatus Gracilibacteria bacterium]